jgi:hypothetical protein
MIFLYRRTSAFVKFGEDGVASELGRVGTQRVVERTDKVVFEQVVVTIGIQSLAYIEAIA